MQQTKWAFLFYIFIKKFLLLNYLVHTFIVWYYNTINNLNINLNSSYVSH